ncbi:hypothetical protein B0T24DRAFT_244920 [Lasiosphaeria ovina]|uniref:Uncharacterized protein n=1 Tax=Lasiosphaeria ovina TaxID=92902 RepID=A0AAE0KAT8_9PEZI|nr:hypothetical protein B0T24DRAFT_244920 [Lasiosphaeria ovina]
MIAKDRESMVGPLFPISIQSCVSPRAASKLTSWNRKRHGFSIRRAGGTALERLRGPREIGDANAKIMPYYGATAGCNPCEIVNTNGGMISLHADACMHADLLHFTDQRRKLELLTVSTPALLTGFHGLSAPASGGTEMSCPALPWLAGGPEA